jgi:hypothetical protein
VLRPQRTVAADERPGVWRPGHRGSKDRAFRSHAASPVFPPASSWRPVADQLAHEFDELLQPRRLATEDPVERIAAGCGALVGEALSNPARGTPVARGALAMPNVALSARGRLIEDLGRAAASGRLGDVTPELAFEFAIGIVLQAMQAAAEGRFVRSQAPGVVAGILRAIGVKP